MFMNTRHILCLSKGLKHEGVKTTTWFTIEKTGYDFYIMSRYCLKILYSYAFTYGLY